MKPRELNKTLCLSTPSEQKTTRWNPKENPESGTPKPGCASPTQNTHNLPRAIKKKNLSCHHRTNKKTKANRRPLKQTPNKKLREPKARQKLTARAQENLPPPTLRQIKRVKAKLKVARDRTTSNKIIKNRASSMPLSPCQR